MRQSHFHYSFDSYQIYDSYIRPRVYKNVFKKSKNKIFESTHRIIFAHINSFISLLFYVLLDVESLLYTKCLQRHCYDCFLFLIR